MNKSESIAALAAALANAQGEIENASKNAANAHFKSRYADLAEVINTVRPVFARHGLAVVQFPAFSDGLACVETVITHASGEWMSGTVSAPVVKSDPQGVGSAITYLRRYSLSAAAGIAQEDDDGVAAGAAPARIDIAAELRIVDDCQNIDALRVVYKTISEKCAKTKDAQAWETIKGAIEVRRTEIEK